MTRGRLIALEGIDGSGTTTQQHALAAQLRARGHIVQETGEPSTGEIGRLIRARLAQTAEPIDRGALALLFAADRLDHVAVQIEPALAAGHTVLTDRYLLSSWAYQSLDCDRSWVRTINARAPWPDLTLWLDVPAPEAMRRVTHRPRHSEQSLEIYETPPLLERLAHAYTAYASDPNLLHIVRVDGNRPLSTVTADLIAACIAQGL